MAELSLAQRRAICAKKGHMWRRIVGWVRDPDGGYLLGDHATGGVEFTHCAMCWAQALPDASLDPDPVPHEPHVAAEEWRTLESKRTKLEQRAAEIRDRQLKIQKYHDWITIGPPKELMP